MGVIKRKACESFGVPLESTKLVRHLKEDAVGRLGDHDPFTVPLLLEPLAPAASSQGAPGPVANNNLKNPAPSTPENEEEQKSSSSSSSSSDSESEDK